MVNSISGGTPTPPAGDHGGNQQFPPQLQSEMNQIKSSMEGYYQGAEGSGLAQMAVQTENSITKGESKPKTVAEYEQQQISSATESIKGAVKSALKRGVSIGEIEEVMRNGQATSENKSPASLSDSITGQINNLKS